MRLDKITDKMGVLFQYIAVVYLFVGLYYFVNLPIGDGDESLFISYVDTYCFLTVLPVCRQAGVIALPVRPDKY